MAQPYFPKDFEQVNNTPTLSLGASLYCIKATLFDPRADTDGILPPHHWILLFRGAALGSVMRAVARSGPSDSNGRCVLTRPAATLEPGLYSLGISPASAEARKWYMRDGEAWIDLDSRTWAPPPNGATAIERRSLVRIPVWSTVRKAQMGGGFKVAPPNAARFVQEGTLSDLELTPFGTPQAPWDIALDFGWARARVRYFFYNWKANQQEVLPPGLVVEAVRASPAGHAGVSFDTIGKGCAISHTDGTAYVLLEGDRRVWQSCAFQFRAPAHTRVDLSQSAPAGRPDDRLTADGPMPDNLHERNALPKLWHSHGMRANYGTGPTPSPSAAREKTWNELRADIAHDAGSLDTTLFFHLDDVVLCDNQGTPVPRDAQHQPPTLLDHFLAILAQKSDKPYQSEIPSIGSVLAANRVFSIGVTLASGQRVLDLSTRLIHYEGTLYDLRDDRVGGDPGLTLGVGARAALANQHPHVRLSQGNPHMHRMSWIGRQPYELHAIDVPGVPDPQTARPLQHMMIFLPLTIHRDGKFPAERMGDVYRFLHEAGERWSQGHPGIRSVSQNKRYALVPHEPADRQRIITRIRTFFCESTSNRLLNLNLEHGEGRSGQHEGVLGLVDEWITLLDSAVLRNLGQAGFVSADSDGVELNPNTLAHELGHALGAPDEYAEIVDPAKDIDPSVHFVEPRLPSWDQLDEGWGDGRPFWNDVEAMMSHNMLPRLRHFWHHARVFNEHEAFSQLPGRPYRLVHETFGPGGIEYPIDPSSKPP